MLEHPEIGWMERTGYTSDNQPESHYCDECGKCLDCEDIYADGSHEYLCRSCLLILHDKSNWW